MTTPNLTTQFLRQLRLHLEAWRAGEIDYAAYTATQQETWIAIRRMGRAVEEEVLRAFQDQPMMNASRAPRLHQRTVTNAAAQPGTSRFHNRLYAIETERTQAGHQILRVTATDPEGRHGTPRQLAAFIYELVADMERRSEVLGAHWRIIANVENANVFIALTGEDHGALAEEFATSVIASLE